LKSLALAVPDISGGINLQKALQMQRDYVTCHKYEISHLKRLAIEERPSKTLKGIAIAALR